MIVEVIAAKIGETGRAEPQPVQTALIQPVARSLQGRMGDAVVLKLGERLVQRHGIRCCQPAIVRAPARDSADRPQARRLETREGEDLSCEDGHRRLAARACHGDNLLRLTSVKACCHERQRPARVVRSK